MGLDINFYKCKRGDIDRYEEAHKEWTEQQPESSKIHNDDYEKLPDEEKKKIQQDVREWYDKEPTMKAHGISDIGYFRKVNFLMAFFAYYGNCEFKEISKSELEDLKERTDKLAACKPVRRVKHWYNEENKKKPNPVKGEDYWVENIYRKADQELAEDLLPTQSGFFYGSTEYNHYYWEDVKEVNEWVKGVLNDLDDEKEQVLMYCWW